MTIHQAQQHLKVTLQTIYDGREAANIANLVMEKLTGLERVHRIVHQYNPLLPDQLATLETYTAALMEHQPLQYVLQEAWFYGLKLFVDENVLIPRPETEELVQWIIDDHNDTTLYSRFPAFDIIPPTADRMLPTSDFLPPASHVKPFTFPMPRILDIGTGSGCIPIALKTAFPATAVYACDVSAGALQVARKNAKLHGAGIEWLQLDFLKAANWQYMPQVDIIVSNPPYIPVRDMITMHDNVLQYEPHLALFVENDDPLLFYRHIALFARDKLLPGGSVYVEIHEDLGPDTCQLFEESGLSPVVLKKDLQGKNRMVKAEKY